MCAIGEDSHIITSSVHAIAVGAAFSTTVATTLGPATAAMGELDIGGSITMITSPRRHDDLCVICVPHMNEEVALYFSYVFAKLV